MAKLNDMRGLKWDVVANVLGDVVAKLTLIHGALNFKIQLLLKTILNRYAFSYFFYQLWVTNCTVWHFFLKKKLQNNFFSLRKWQKINNSKRVAAVDLKYNASRLALFSLVKKQYQTRGFDQLDF